jgi:hypothetical protein
VDFPEPLSPITPKISPVFMLKLTSSTACKYRILDLEILNESSGKNFLILLTEINVLFSILPPSL